jgi:beta-xylosidase
MTRGIRGLRWWMLSLLMLGAIINYMTRRPNFTGAFVGVACQDLAGSAMPADFDYFDYQERGFRPRIERSDA